MNTQIIKKIWFFAFIILPSLVIANSIVDSSIVDSSIINKPVIVNKNVLSGLSNNVSISDIVLIVTLIAGLLTILTIAIKAIRNGNGDQKNDGFNELKSDYNKLAEQVTDLTKLNVASKFNNIENDLNELDDTVNNYLKRKLYNLSENFTILETKVVNLNKHFDEFNQDRKEEHKQVKNEINTLRENIREDINDVKDIIMKLMMALKIDSDED